jgi:hypothetical protein
MCVLLFAIDILNYRDKQWVFKDEIDRLYWRGFLTLNIGVVLKRNIKSNTIQYNNLRNEFPFQKAQIVMIIQDQIENREK